MIIANQIKETLASAESGTILTIADFGIESRYQAALVKALNRFVNSGKLQKISKGKYYKPKNTAFGMLKPSLEETVKDLLKKNGCIVGYITGAAAFASMALTTQISSAITIGTNKYRRPVKRGEYKVFFIYQPNTLTEENIPLLRILDAIKLIKEIPATTPDDTVAGIGELIISLPEKQREELCTLALAYTPYVRALLGAILEFRGLCSYNLASGLNGVTSYLLPISTAALPNKQNWNIR